ncbi:MAG TPA: hypothetical protein VHT51_09965 [Micropepsaceae bacterium]|jgi:hypothetical protein|nr:hypothetical protein [Micropepsaceae bacterium]
MTAFNIVRFRTKPGREQDFIEGHRSLASEKPERAHRFVLVRTGDNSFCALGEWESFDAIVEARPMMIGFLDRFRDMLEEMGEGLGVTDPVSGEVVVDLGLPASAAAPKKTRRTGAAKRKPASKARATSPRLGKPAPKKKAAAKKSPAKTARSKAKKPAGRKILRRR